MANINQLESLRVFRAVVEQGSFSAAARTLSVSPAWVSKSIERFEEQLGVALFQRNTRHVQITEDGERCYEQGMAVLKQWQFLEDELSRSQHCAEGLLRISIPMSWGLSCFDRVLDEFMERYPKIVLDVQLEDRQVNLLEENYDMALRLTDKLPDSSLLCRKVMNYHLLPCASVDYLAEHGEPQSPQDLNKHDCLLFSLPGMAHKWRFGCMENSELTCDVYLQPRLLSNNSRLLRSALLAGKGIALIPSFMVEDDLKQGRLQRVLPLYQGPPLDLYTLRPAQRRTSYRLKLLHDFLCERLKAPQD